ncbi:hypothetical protein CW706_00780 [Candidatus Bathyarchaeota archaeon]|nr:MAG: hypothetical protein CW706_00780 [Candidatus Bathyarchaeota archaeon]
MNTSEIVNILENLLKSLEKEKESLKHILLGGKISHEVFNFLNKKIERMEILALELEKNLKDEKEFQREINLKGIRIFETLLVDFRHRLFMGDMGEEDFQRCSKIISRGLDSIKRQVEGKKEVIMTLQQIKNSPSKEFEHFEKKNNIDENEESPKIHCMNPWKPECRNTDIEVSIYYKGKMIPICRECWKEIANRDVEWSSI